MAKVMWVMQHILGTSIAKSGARQAFLLTSDKFGPGECWRVDEKCEPVTNAGVLDDYRQAGWKEKISSYTSGIIEQVLATSG